MLAATTAPAACLDPQIIAAIITGVGTIAAAWVLIWRGKSALADHRAKVLVSTTLPIEIEALRELFASQQKVFNAFFSPRLGVIAVLRDGKQAPTPAQLNKEADTLFLKAMCDAQDRSLYMSDTLFGEIGSFWTMLEAVRDDAVEASKASDKVIQYDETETATRTIKEAADLLKKIRNDIRDELGIGG